MARREYCALDGDHTMDGCDTMNGCYHIKESPEDFIVRELTTINPAREGSYSYWWMRKRSCNTIQAVESIASLLGIPTNKVGFAGSKDKVAVTEQLISIDRKFEGRIKGFSHERISIEFAGRGDTPICFGELKGNYFDVMVRKAQKKPATLRRFINYFGEQRFGRNNAEAGKAVVKKDFRKAAEMMDKPAVKKALEERKTDYVGAIKKIPRELLMMYIAAYQSLIWNRTAEEYIKEQMGGEGRAGCKDTDSLDNIQIPLVGFGTEYDDERAERIIRRILDEEGVTERDFIIRQLPEASAEGDSRWLFAEVKDLKIESVGCKKSEDKNKKNGKKSDYRLRFFLPKGCYATEMIRQMFG
ncbi:MAG: tRNA pseudouridine(13) synthase TruD [Candidatus Woesearchaeota archaeon]